MPSSYFLVLEDKFLSRYTTYESQVDYLHQQISTLLEQIGRREATMRLRELGKGLFQSYNAYEYVWCTYEICNFLTAWVLVMKFLAWPEVPFFLILPIVAVAIEIEMRMEIVSWGGFSVVLIKKFPENFFFISPKLLNPLINRRTLCSLDRSSHRLARTAQP